MTKDYVAISSLAMDLKRVAVGYYGDSNKTARRFSQEALKRIEETGMLHSYPQLIEIGSGKVAQVEHTIMVEKNKKTITTL